MQKSKTEKFSIFNSLDVKLKFLTNRVELTQFSVESSCIELKIWAIRLNLDSSSKCQLETRLDDQSNHWWHYYERAEWYENIIYLSWVCTFFLESTDDSRVLHTQLERSCCDVVLYYEALQLSELRIYH